MKLVHSFLNIDHLCESEVCYFFCVMKKNQALLKLWLKTKGNRLHIDLRQILSIEML